MTSILIKKYLFSPFAVLKSFTISDRVPDLSDKFVLSHFRIIFVDFFRELIKEQKFGQYILDVFILQFGKQILDSVDHCRKMKASDWAFDTHKSENRGFLVKNLFLWKFVPTNVFSQHFNGYFVCSLMIFGGYKQCGNSSNVNVFQFNFSLFNDHSINDFNRCPECLPPELVNIASFHKPIDKSSSIDSDMMALSVIKEHSIFQLEILLSLLFL